MCGIAVLALCTSQPGDFDVLAVPLHNPSIQRSCEKHTSRVLATYVSSDVGANGVQVIRVDSQIRGYDTPTHVWYSQDVCVHIYNPSPLSNPSFLFICECFLVVLVLQDGDVIMFCHGIGHT